MKNTNRAQVGMSRRTLIGGAACIAFAASARADAAPIAARPDHMLLFGTNAGLQDATQMLSADASLENGVVRVSVTPVGNHNALPVRGVSVRFSVPDAPKKFVPFHAWHYGAAPASFQVPVHGASGLTLLLTGHDGTESVVTLSGANDAAGPKLREGTYVIAARAGLPPRMLLRLAPSADGKSRARIVVRTPNGLTEPAASYLALTISRADG